MIEIAGKDEGIKKQVTCRNCTTILRYAPVDTRKETIYDYTGSKDVNKFIICPCCNNKIYVS